MSHYTVTEIRSMQELRGMFPDGQADALNWLFLSTSGIHGSYGTLDGWTPDAPWITVLVLAPRMVRARYGEIEITAEDIPWLRRVVETTITEVAKSQEGNRTERVPA